MMKEVKNQINHQKVHELVQITRRYFEQEEIDILRTDPDIQIGIYFDTFYILSMIQGFWELQETESSQIHAHTFENPDFLVKSLAYLKYLENIKILLPHVAELVKQLDKTYLLPLKAVSKSDRDAFLEMTGLKSLKEIGKAIDSNQLDDFIEKLTPKAETIFKANYILTQIYWHKRFDHLFEGDDPIIKYDNYRYDHTSILESDIFNQIIDAIAVGNRATKTINNYRDAMSLCMILRKIEDFNSGRNNEIPLFYLTPRIQKSLPTEIIEKFQIEYLGKSINILKDTEFFILDAMFHLNPDSVENEIFSKLKNLKDVLDLYGEISTKFAADHINEIVSGWEKFRNQDFFQRIWEDSRGGKIRLSDNLRDLIQYEELYKNEDFVKDWIAKGKDKITRRLSKRVEEFVFLEEIYNQAGDLKTFLRKNLNDKNEHIMESDIFTDEGLIRFSPPRGYVEEEINSFWKGLLDAHFDGDKEDFRQLKVSLTRKLFEGVLKDKKNIDYDKIIIGISIFFVFGKKDLIIKIVEAMKNNYDKCYQIALIYTACLLKDAQDEKIRKKIIDLIRHIELMPNYDNNYKMWIGVSYLKFNLWETLSNTPFLNSSDEDLGVETSEFDHYLKDALELSKKAFQEIEKIMKRSSEKRHYRQMKYYYALNNYIYYTIRCKDSKVLNHKDFHKLAVKLQSIEYDEVLSESRFSDTLAHYYYALSLNEEDRLGLLEAAEEHIDNAKKTAVFVDHRYNFLRDRIQVELRKVRRKRN